MTDVSEDTQVVEGEAAKPVIDVERALEALSLIHI